jgi:hypothetical protein
VIEREWRVVRIMRVLLLAAVTGIVAACSTAADKRHTLVARQPEFQLVVADDADYQDCTQERDCTCGWCPPYGNDDD